MLYYLKSLLQEFFCKRLFLNRNYKAKIIFLDKAQALSVFGSGIIDRK